MKDLSLFGERIFYFRFAVMFGKRACSSVVIKFCHPVFPVKCVHTVFF